MEPAVTGLHEGPWGLSSLKGNTSPDSFYIWFSGNDTLDQNSVSKLEFHVDNFAWKSQKRYLKVTLKTYPLYPFSDSVLGVWDLESGPGEPKTFPYSLSLNWDFDWNQINTLEKEGFFYDGVLPLGIEFSLYKDSLKTFSGSHTEGILYRPNMGQVKSFLINIKPRNSFSAIYPNPFSKKIFIGFSIPKISHIRITDFSGRLIKQMIKSRFWDGKTQNGVSVPPGPYIITGFSSTTQQRFIVIKK